MKRLTESERIAAGRDAAEELAHRLSLAAKVEPGPMRRAALRSAYESFHAAQAALDGSAGILEIYAHDRDGNPIDESEWDARWSARTEAERMHRAERRVLGGVR